MIAQRFRPIGWVLGVALAIMLLYVIQLKVATERGQLNAVDDEIALVNKDIKRLETEFKTRASMRQLERWNGNEELLALSAPQARQYLPSEDIISELGPDRFVGGSTAPPPPMVLADEQAGQVPVDQLAVQAAPLSKQDRAVQTALTSQPAEPMRVASLAKPMESAAKKPVAKKANDLPREKAKP